MKMQVEAIGSVPVKQWKQMIQNSPTGHFFNTPNWAVILRETYGYQIATTLFDIDGTEILVPMMEINRFPFSSLESMPLGYGGFISPSNPTPDMVQSVMKKIVGRRHLKLYMTLPPFTKITPHEEFQIQKVQTEWNYTHVLALDTNYEKVEEQFHKEPKKRIKMAEASGLTVRLTNDLKDFRKVYDLYTHRSIEWGYREPPHPWTLYQNLQQYGAQHVKLRIAEINDMPVGGTITLEFKKNAFLWLILSPKEYWRYNSTYLLLKDTIQSLCERRFSQINLGGSGKLDGVRHFKERFGGRMVPLYRYEAYSLLGKILIHRTRGILRKV
jgi:hypothetical protein